MEFVPNFRSLLNTYLNQHETEINDIFIYNVASNIEINIYINLEPQSTGECQQINDWSKSKEAIQAKLNISTGIFVQSHKVC